MKKKQHKPLIFFVLSMLCYANPAQAVPTSFLLSEAGNQRDVTWSLLQSKHFKVYFDEKAQPVAKYSLASLEYAYPYLSNIFKISLKNDSILDVNSKRNSFSSFEYIPVILGTRIDKGGFANPVTQNIEVQVSSPTPASLYQHELVHRIMYEHFDPYIGAAGRVFSLAMIPTWWIEGVAEYLTESVGRIQTEGLMRTLSLKNAWPTFDSLHALYAAQGDFGIGYATSGKFINFLIDKLPSKNLATLNDDFFYKTITPPFVNATNSLLNNKFQRDDSALYEEFKTAQSKYWGNYLQNVRSIKQGKSTTTVLESTGVPQSVFLENHVITPELYSDATQSSLIITGLNGEKAVRRPISIQGSYHFSVLPSKNGGEFWSSVSQTMPNKTNFDKLVYVKYAGELTDLSSNLQLSSKYLELSSKDNPVNITGIVASEPGTAFVSVDILGKQSLFYVDAAANKITELRSWFTPDSIKLLPKSLASTTSSCVSAIIDSDYERTSLEQFCANGTSKILLAKENLYLISGFERSNGTYLLLIGQGKLTGLIEFDGEKYGKNFVFSEYSPKIIPGVWESEDAFGLWVFAGSGFTLEKSSLRDIAHTYQNNAELEKTSGVLITPKWTPYIPPFVSLADSRNSEEVLKPQVNEELISKTLETKEAPYLHNHLFSYPNIIPPYFGGWSLGLVSVPYVDEMERDRLEIYGQYNPVSKVPSAEIRYVNNRIADGFSLSLLANDKFNGIYYWNPVIENNKTKYYIQEYPTSDNSYSRYNFLKERGLSISLVKRYSLFDMTQQFNAKTSYLSPYAEKLYKAEVKVLGVQKTILAELGSSIYLNLHNSLIRTTNKEAPQSRYLSFATDLAMSLAINHSLYVSQNAWAENKPAVNFQKFAASYSSRLAYKSHSLTLHQSITGTVGSNPMLLKEIFQPYKTYLLGSNSGLNNLNYSIIGNNGLFAINSGIYSYRTSIDYNFPIAKHVDKHFLIFYFDNIQGEFIVGHGGVAESENFSLRKSCLSTSLAARATIDIKGFQVYPSLAYGRLLNSNGWALFSELSFSEFF